MVRAGRYNREASDRVAIVTGGAQGIGRAIAERYLKEGARVAIADLNGDGARATAAALGNGTIAVETDIARQDSIDAMVDAVVERFGRIDVLVNNAAVFDMAPILEITRDSYDTVFDVNVKGLLFTLQAVARQMVAQGKGGKIINLASQAGRCGEPLGGVYCASKAAVISLTQSAGLSLIGQGINVNAIAPGVVDTPMWDIVEERYTRYENRPSGEKRRLVGEAVPFGRMGLPEDQTGAAVFLASSDSDYVVAQTFNVNGGNVMN